MNLCITGQRCFSVGGACYYCGKPVVVGQMRDDTHIVHAGLESLPEPPDVSGPRIIARITWDPSNTLETSSIRSILNARMAKGDTIHMTEDGPAITEFNLAGCQIAFIKTVKEIAK